MRTLRLKVDNIGPLIYFPIKFYKIRDFKTMISLEAALSQILAAIHPLGLEKVNFLDALGRVIGEDIVASRPIPPKDNAAMDGYALRSEDIRGASPGTPVVLDVIEDIPAGRIPQKRVGKGQAARIMTGAPVPEGADAVMRMEDTEKIGKKVRIFVEAPAGQDIRLAGEDVRQDETVISRGEYHPAGGDRHAGGFGTFVYFRLPEASGCGSRHRR